MWWTDGSRSAASQVGARAVRKHKDERRSCSSYLSSGRKEVFDAKLEAIGHALDLAIENRETLQKHRMETVAIIRDPQAAIQHTAHLDPRPGLRLPRLINSRAQSLHCHGITTRIHWVPGNSGIPRNEDEDHQANIAQEATGSTVIEQPYTSASDCARSISEG
jgi:hypothetical protein